VGRSDGNLKKTVREIWWNCEEEVSIDMVKY